MIDADTRGSTPINHLSGLLYELLDAHLDTIELAGSLDLDESWADGHESWAAHRHESWAAHLDYLRDLQRVGRETLARVAA